MKCEGRNKPKFFKEMTYQNCLINSTSNIRGEKLKSLKNDNINNYISTVNFRNQLKKNKSFQTKKILDNFKIIIKQTEVLKNKILNSKKYFNNDNSYINDSNNSDIKFNDNISIINKNEVSEMDYNIDDFVNFEESINTKKINNKNGGFNINNTKKFNLKNNYKRKETEDNNSLKIINQNLSNSNIRLIHQNNFLEKTIDDFKNIINKNYTKNNQQIFDQHDKNFINFINNLKASNHKNICENLELYKNIVDILKQIQILHNKYKLNNNIYKNLCKKLKKEEKIEQITKNKDNKKLSNLKEEQNKLNKELDKLNNILKELKTKENTLSEKYEANLKSMQDCEEIISKLNDTIKYLSNEQLSLSRISSLKHINNSNSKLYDVKINQLNTFIKSLKYEKHLVLTKNYKLKEENKKLEKKKINDNENLKNKNLQIQLTELKDINMINKNNIGKKEKQIKILKNIINNLSKSMKENNINDILLEYNIQQLIKYDSNDIEYINLLKEEQLNENIKKQININEKKENEIVNISKAYEDILNIKEKELLFLENKLNNKTGLLKTLKDKVKPLYKKNILPKNNSFILNKKANIDKENKIIKLNKNNYINNINNIY